LRLPARPDFQSSEKRRKTGQGLGRSRWLACIALLALIAWVAPGRVGGQISPGPLARAHKSLDGTAQCISCHKLAAGEATFKCLDCHTEIAAHINGKHGFHARSQQKPGSQDCARCHSDHNGEDFALIKWNQQTFDHTLTGYKLEGKHVTDCNKCHNPTHILAEERPLIKRKDLTRTFMGMAQTCTTCHEDFHKGQLGPNCASCHNFEDWKKVTQQFDHGKTRYPLTGAHLTVQCAKCHTAGPDGKARYKPLPFNECTDCHQDPHKGSFKDTCQTCHTTAAWKRVITSALSQHFDHSKTKYPLEGKHQTVECISCHAKGDFKKELAFDKCSKCHTPDPHSGQFAKRADKGECNACHTLEGWKPTTFDVKAHAKSDYPLVDKHAEVKCEKCHLPAGKATIYKVKFARCFDCHQDEHEGQFAVAPHLNKCDDCHNIKGFKPSQYTLAKHKDARLTLTGAHLATPCNDCHKESAALQPKPKAQYYWANLDCTSCHEDVHKGQFKERMAKLGSDQKPLGCLGCHSTKTWKDMAKFDHSTTDFPLVGSHRSTACVDCHKPPNLETKLMNVDFKAAPKKCEECHQDVHGEQFAKAGSTPCGDCHNSNKWKPSMFDHNRTEFPLEGLHIPVPCSGCHKLFKPVNGKDVLFYKPTPKACSDCHGPDVANRPLKG